MTSKNKQFAEAMRALGDGDTATAIRIGEHFLSSVDEGDHASGYLCLGYAFEDCGVASKQSLERALSCYRKLSITAPGQLPFFLLARVSMKIGGDDGFRKALGYLEEARRYGNTPEYVLGLAHYFRTGPRKDLAKAKELYFKAATSGRFSGFFGYSEVARELNQRYRAFWMDCARIFAGPVIALLIGRRAQESFMD